MNRLTDNAATTTKSPLPWFNSAFSREISLALIVKFLLLGFLWWFFFAGNKQPVNHELVANKLLGAGQSVFPSANIGRNPND